MSEPISEWGTCDNCGAKGSKLTEWDRTRPDNWEGPFRICLRCVRNVSRNMENRR